MERGQEIEGEREKGEAKNNLAVSFSALRKDVVNVLDFMERLKNEDDQKSVDVDRVEKVKLELAFICTYVQLSYSDLEKFEDKMTVAGKKVKDLLRSILYDGDSKMRFESDMQHVLPRFMGNTDDCISSCHHSTSSATMTDEQLNFLLLNLHNLSKYLAEQKFPLVTQYEILRNVCGSIRDFHGLIVNGCVEHEIVECVLPQFQLMAERVGLFIWDDQTDKGSQLSKLDEDDQIDADSRLFKLAHLFLKIIPIELEVMNICFTNLETSTSAEVGRFIKNLLEISPDILREYLIHLQEHMVNVITASTSGARNLHVMIEFLLIILTDVPKDFIHHDKLFDLLARVGALTREVSIVVRDLEEKSLNKESTDETNRATLDLLENIELLKEDLKHVYLKAPDASQCRFPMSDGPLFMHLLHRHLNDLLDSNAYSIALIKEEIGWVKEDLEFIRSFFMKVEQELYKDLWAHILDVAYEAKDVIDSIIVRDNGLLHLIFSLPITLKKIESIKEDVSNLLEKIPMNRGLNVVNSPNKPVESKPLTAAKTIVGFEEETHWIIRKLTSGRDDLDVISITGMPGSGKTTLAYKVYNDKSVSSHFDIRAWCTVGQEYDEKKLLVKIFNQVTDSDSKLSENIDVADKLRKQLYGKRYLIVLDDLWDTATWDELTRPFPDVEKGSRIIFTTREKGVALHGKRNTDPLNLRPLRPEESWELLEKRAFGNESCPDELLDVGKEIAQNCKGLPLVADLIGGVIAGLEKKMTLWLEFRNNLSSFIFKNEEEVMKVIGISYDHLPDHLKPCLLYLASVHDAREIEISVLKFFWRPEGLVEQTEMVEVYLDNLISSSLVICLNEIGDEPTCRLHDLVHEFCLIKSREEKLFDLISSSAPSSSSDLMPRQMAINYDMDHFGFNNLVLLDSKKKRHSGKHLYSLAIDGDELDGCLSDLCHVRHLRLLRVLYLDPKFIRVKDSLLNEICMLNHLRCLCIGTEVTALPSSFSNLLNLETLIVENKGPPLVLLPIIWNLVKLQMLCVDASLFDLDTYEPIRIAEDSKLENLRVLQGLTLSNSKDTEDIFKRLPNLQRLSFDLKESRDFSTQRYWFPKLDFLNELESLEVTFIGSNSNDNEPSVGTNQLWDFRLPSSLKKLSLWKFPLTFDALSTIARLPKLEELSLLYPKIQGEEWNMGEEDTFENLKRLFLYEVNFAKWEVGEESFPVLEKLDLWECRKLVEIPSSFGDIGSLKIMLAVLFSALRKDVVNVLDFMERLKNEDDQKAVDVDRVEKLKLELAFICTYVQLSYSDLEKFEDKMTVVGQKVKDLLRSILYDGDSKMRFESDMQHVLPRFMGNIDDCISSCHHSTSSATMTDEQLNFLLLNLHNLSKYLAEQKFPFVTQYEILRNVCGSIRDFHGLIVNGCIEHEIVECVLPQFQLMAERVGLFIWDDQTDKRSQLSELDEDDQIDADSRLLKLAHLFLKIIPIELEVMNMCFTNLETSTSAEVGRFIEKLLEISPDILREYLIHLQEHMVNFITPSTSGARNIHVMIEFLLIILTDVPKDFIHHDKLFDLLARVGALTREVSIVVRDLEEKSLNKESTDETNRATLDLLENIELLKDDLKHVYLKAPDASQCRFPMNDGPVFMHLLHRHLNDLLDSNAYSIALIKEEIGWVKEDLEFIRSFFMKVEQELYKDLWAYILDVAYEAKDVIDSIIVRDNGLLHLIFSLPITLKKIESIKEDVSNLLEKIPKNRGLDVVNSPNKPVESKPLTAAKTIVGFEEETHWIIRKLTSGRDDLDVISITGMPGSGKTTLAYKVYNDKSVSSHFDIRAWCTVGQEYDEKKLLVKIFNQVTGSDSKLSENIDVADKLRKQLYGKRYLIVLDDLWDTATWDELTRPFPDVEKGSRIIFTTREKGVALHGKRNTDPLNLRLLRPEESWELLEKRAFGKERCPDQLLDVGKEIAQNCKGLPLVADLIGGVIAGLEKKKTLWLEFRNNLSSFIFKNEEEVMKVIGISYDHLPDHLKPCLLYLASVESVQGGIEIDILFLKVIWRAEGLVEQTEMVEVYLDNLISSSLVICLNEIGDEPTCRLHDLVHEFCLIKSREEKLFDLISSSAPSSSSDLMPRRMTIDYDMDHFGFNNLVLLDSKKKRHSGKHLYSLAIDGNELDGRLSDICHLRHLRLLRVLDLDPDFIRVKDSLLNEICMLNHLRFLRIGTEVTALPSSFSNLLNLQTLIVKNEGPPLVLLPIIGNFVKLQVLTVVPSLFYLDTYEPIRIAEDSKLENLRVLQGLTLSYSKDTEDIFKRFPNLQDLSFYLKESWDFSTERYWFPKLDFLNELESLDVTFIASNSNDNEPSVGTNQLWDFRLPSSLKKLYLWKFPLTSDALSTIARLPKLEKLFLFSPKIQGEEWNMGEEDTFENLKCLLLCGVTLSKWEVGEESFPVLENLQLKKCRKLVEIPPSFGDIGSLKIIRLVDSPQLENSANNIKQYAEDMRGGDELQVRLE